MSLILRQVIGELRGKRISSLTADPELKKKLTETEKQLNSILKKWKFGDQPIKTSQEFLANFEPWIKNQLEQQKELKVFLAKKGVNNLQEANTKLTNRELAEGEEEQNALNQLTNLNQELTTLKRELAEKETLWNNTEQDYLARIEELLRTKSAGETPEDYEELIAERDELVRDKKTLEQEILALNNQVKNKVKEVQAKEKSLETLKKDKDKQEVSLNKKITEKNGLITTQQKEINQLKEKYSKQGQLLDQEQLENNKLTEKVEALEARIKELTQ